MSWISKIYSKMKQKTTNSMTSASLVQNSISSHINQNAKPLTGQQYFDSSRKVFMIYDGDMWRKLVTAPVKDEHKSLLDELDKEDPNDVLETVLLLLMRNNLVSDINEFKEILEAAKLARQMTE